MEFSAFAHVALTVSKFDECVAFYDKVMSYLGMKPYITSPLYRGWYAGEIMFVIVRGAPQGDSFSQWRVGLQHLSFRARNREEVDGLYNLLKEIGAKIVSPAEESKTLWPGYYSVVFDDPDGTRLEMNYIPEQGWQAVAQSAESIARSSP